MADAFSAHQNRTQLDRAASEFLSLTDGVVSPSTNPALNLLVVDDDEQIREVRRVVASETW
jgi:hypothetical protein